MLRRLSVLLVAGTLLLAGCSNPFHTEDESDRTSPPKIGACRDLRAADLGSPTNVSPVVGCSEEHTAQTFLIGELPGTTDAYVDKKHGKYVHGVCQKGLRAFLGADESKVMRSQLSWAWFRPSERGWDQGARWFRCDVVGGPADATRLRALPSDARGMFSEQQEPDAWVTCALGDTVAKSSKVPCTRKHTWRAVTTIKVGKPDDDYPGDRIVQVRSRDYCQESVGGWLGYPPEYDFGYTWFREDRWAAGNRRSICWAKTAK